MTAQQREKKYWRKKKQKYYWFLDIILDFIILELT
jgi:hypothetical protein